MYINISIYASYVYIYIDDTYYIYTIQYIYTIYIYIYAQLQRKYISHYNETYFQFYTKQICHRCELAMIIFLFSNI